MLPALNILVTVLSVSIGVTSGQCLSQPKKKVVMSLFPSVVVPVLVALSVAQQLTHGVNSRKE